MRTTMKVVSMLACTVFLNGCQSCFQAKVDTQTIEAEIMQAHKVMKEAAQARNVDALYTHVADMDKGVIIEDGLLFMTKEESKASTSKGFGMIQKIDYTYDNQHITILSPTLVLWVGDGAATSISNSGRKRSGAFAETIVFNLQDGEWKVLHAHRSAPGI